MKVKNKPKKLSRLMEAYNKLLDEHEDSWFSMARRQDFKFGLGDTVRVKPVFGDPEWTGQVVGRARNPYSSDHVYEVSNAPHGHVRGRWLPMAYEEEVELVTPADFDGFDLFDRVYVKTDEHEWYGFIMAFHKQDDGSYKYEVSEAPNIKDDMWLPLVKSDDLTMVQPWNSGRDPS